MTNSQQRLTNLISPEFFLVLPLTRKMIKIPFALFIYFCREWEFPNVKHHYSHSDYKHQMVYLWYIIPLRHMNCLRGGRVVTRGVGACQFDSHRRLWWRLAVVAAAFIFPRPVKLITDFIEFYNIYITMRTERTCWKCSDSRYVKIRSIVLVLMTHLF